jgi:CBS domain-containing protein
MFAKVFISDSIPTISTSTTGIQALALMDEHRISHLPIVNNIEFLGLISEDDILNQNTFEESVGNHLLSLSGAYIEPNQHVFDVLTLAAEKELSIIPVVDKNNRYIGAITLLKLLCDYTIKSSLVNPGGIIMLECNINDYNLQEIAHIVESNDAKILHCFVSNNQDSTKLEVSLKINKMNISAVLQTFERYGYQILAGFVESDYTEDIRDRYDMLMNYLNI